MTDATKILLEALKKCRKRFAFYVGYHLDKSDFDKAAENEQFVKIADDAIAAAEAGAHGSDAAANPAFNERFSTWQAACGIARRERNEARAERDAMAAKLAELEAKVTELTETNAILDDVLDEVNRELETLTELEDQEPIGEVTHSDVLPNAEGKYRHEFLSDFRIGVQAELYARPVTAEEGIFTVTTDETGRCVMVSRQDEDHRILSVIWEADGKPAESIGYTLPADSIGARKLAQLGGPEHWKPMGLVLHNGVESVAITEHGRVTWGDTPAQPVNARLLTAAKAVVARWETPNWKDAPATAGFIYDLRDAIVAAEAQQAGPVRLTDEEVDKALSARVPGGSEVRDWFLPHDTGQGLANIRTVVRAIETAVLRKNGMEN